MPKHPGMYYYIHSERLAVNKIPTQPQLPTVGLPPKIKSEFNAPCTMQILRMRNYTLKPLLPSAKPSPNFVATLHRGINLNTSSQAGIVPTSFASLQRQTTLPSRPSPCSSPPFSHRTLTSQSPPHFRFHSRISLQPLLPTRGNSGSDPKPVTFKSVLCPSNSNLQALVFFPRNKNTASFIPLVPFFTLVTLYLTHSLYVFSGGTRVRVAASVSPITFGGIPDHLHFVNPDRAVYSGSPQSIFWPAALGM